MKNWKDDAENLSAQGKTISQIARQLAFVYDWEYNETVYRRVQKHLQRYEPGAVRVNRRLRKNTSRKKVVGVIGDLHCPFNHPNYLQFLIDTFK